MCGIVGVARMSGFGLGYVERKIFIDLLIADAVRGTDGTGVIAVGKDGKVDTIKIGGTPYDLIRSEMFQKKWESWVRDDIKILIGHNRAATRGSATTANAHPFMSEDNQFVMVHNGTLEWRSDLPLKDYDVDSLCLTDSIGKHGVKEAISQAAGAWAIAGYFIKHKEMVLLHNKERPLTLMEDFGQDRLAFASEGRMLEWACSRNNVTLPAKDVPTDTLLTIPLGNKLKINEEGNILGKPASVYYGAGSLASTTEDGDEYAEMVSRLFDDNFKEDLGSLAKAGGFVPKKGETVAAKVIDLRPYYQKAAGTGTTGTALAQVPTESKLGKNAQKHRAKSAKKTGKEKVNYKVTQSYNNYQQFDKVAFRLLDFKEEAPDRFLVEGKSPKLPFARIMMHIKGSLSIDTLFDAGFARAEIKTILEDSDSKSPEALIWVSNPEPVWDFGAAVKGEHEVKNFH